jgi:hypothetical protein
MAAYTKNVKPTWKKSNSRLISEAIPSILTGMNTAYRETYAEPKRKMEQEENVYNKETELIMDRANKINKNNMLLAEQYAKDTGGVYKIKGITNNGFYEIETMSGEELATKRKNNDMQKKTYYRTASQGALSIDKESELLESDDPELKAIGELNQGVKKQKSSEVIREKLKNGTVTDAEIDMLPKEERQSAIKENKLGQIKNLYKDATTTVIENSAQSGFNAGKKALESLTKLSTPERFAAGRNITSWTNEETSRYKLNTDLLVNNYTKVISGAQATDTERKRYEDTVRNWMRDGKIEAEAITIIMSDMENILARKKELETLYEGSNQPQNNNNSANPQTMTKMYNGKMITFTKNPQTGKWEA